MFNKPAFEVGLEQHNKVKLNFLSIIAVNLVTPKAAAKLEHLFNKTV